MIRDFESSFMGGKSSFFTNNNGGPNAAHNDAAVGGGDDPPVVENGGAAVVRQPTIGGLVRLKGGHPGIFVRFGHLSAHDASIRVGGRAFAAAERVVADLGRGGTQANCQNRQP